MLKIVEYRYFLAEDGKSINREKIELKELEKFGFTKREDSYWVKKVYLGNADDDKNFYEIAEKDRKIELTRLDGELDDILYDLIQAGLVEKVKEK